MNTSVSILQKNTEIYKIVRNNFNDISAYLDQHFDFEINLLDNNNFLKNFINKDPAVKRKKTQGNLLEFYTTTATKYKGLFMRKFSVDIVTNYITANNVKLHKMPYEGRCVAAPVVFESERGTEMFVQFNYNIERGKQNKSGIAHLISVDDGLTFEFVSIIKEFPEESGIMIYDANHYVDIDSRGIEQEIVLATVYSPYNETGTSFHRILKQGNGDWLFEETPILSRDEIPFHWNKNDPSHLKEWFGPEGLQVARFRELKVAMWANFMGGQKLGFGLMNNQNKITPISLIFNLDKVSQKLGSRIERIGHGEFITCSKGEICIDEKNEITALVQVLPIREKFRGNVESLWRIAKVKINADDFYRALRLSSIQSQQTLQLINSQLIEFNFSES